MQLKAWPKLAPARTTQISIDVSVVFTLPARLQPFCRHQQVPGCSVACWYLLLCWLAAANFLHCDVQGYTDYIAVVLEVHVLVATNKNIIYVACYSH